jgi:hypothetical protein
MSQSTKGTVGILTFTNVRNYGAVLQAYALSRIIQNMGYESVLINYFKQEPGRIINLYNAIDEGFLRLKHGDFSDLYRKFKAYKGKFVKPKVNPAVEKQTTSPIGLKFREFEALTSKTLTPYKKDSLFEHPPTFDIYLTGSDQVWNYRRSNDLDSFLLRFVQNDSKRIAYAASFGVDTIPAFLARRYSDGLKGFDHIGVREDSGVELVKTLAQRDAQQVVDPTLLLCESDWSSLSRSVELPDLYVLIYSLTLSTNILENALLIAGKLGAKVVMLTSSTTLHLSRDIYVPKEVGPQEFLHLFKNASFIITDSFHGTVFSLIFRRQFIYIGDKYNKQVSRSRSLLYSLGLKARFQDDIALPNELLSIPVDYSTVVPLMVDQRRSSLAYLEHALSA